MKKIIQSAVKILTPKTAPLHNLDLITALNNGFVQQDFVDKSFHKGTLQSYASDNIVGLITFRGQESGRFTYAFNINLREGYQQKLRETLLNFRTAIEAIEYFNIHFYGAHPNTRHAPESLEILTNIQDTLRGIADSAGFITVSFDGSFGRENRSTSIVYDISKKVDLSCCQRFMIGGILLYLPTKQLEEHIHIPKVS